MGFDFVNTLQKFYVNLNGNYEIDFPKLKEVHVVELPCCSPHEHYSQQ